MTTQRISLEYENLSKKFVENTDHFNRQYSAVYLKRLERMSEILLERIKLKWKETYPVYKLYKLSEEKYSKCIVLGTLFKDQKLKPSILKQLAEGNHLAPQPIITNFTDTSDVLYIEDELQRYQIIGSLKKDNLITGVTCALLGKADKNGKFFVEDYLFADYRNQIERPKFNTSVYVVLLSGLNLINVEKINPIIQLFMHWISGFIDLNNIKCENIARVIIAGNSIRSIAEESKPSISMLSKKPESTDTFEAVQILDNFLEELCQLVDVDVLPGENDPSNHILPQKPMHYCMFPKSFPYRSINQVTNPYYCSLNGLKILGSSGQPIKNIMKFSNITDPVEALENCLKWNHICPTAPDTLGCFPFYENDPFIIDDCPHVFFAGNQEKFSTKIVKGEQNQEVRLISIPEFHSTNQVCLLNLKNLDCKVINFQAL